IGLVGCADGNGPIERNERPETPSPEKPNEPPMKPPPEEPGPCNPTLGGPHYIVEGEPFSATVQCATGAPLPDDLVVEDLPAGATYDPASQSLNWTPALDQAGTYEVVLRRPNQDETTTEQLGVI